MIKKYEASENDVEAKERELGEDKKGRGRRRFRSISRSAMPVRLFNHSKMHIERMVRQFKGDDPNFATETAAVRHYVNIGIAAETATTDLRNSLDNTVVKRSIRLAAHSEIAILKKEQEITNELIKDFILKTDVNFADIARGTRAVESKIETGFEAVQTTLLKFTSQFEMILKLLTAGTRTNDYSLRQMVVIRSVFYIFLLGHKTGKIPDAEKDKPAWTTLINKVHERVNALSFTELKAVGSPEVEEDTVRKIAAEVYKSVMPLLKNF